MEINNSAVQVPRLDNWNATTGADASVGSVRSNATQILEPSSHIPKDAKNAEVVGADLLPAPGPSLPEAVASLCEKLKSADLKSIDSDIADIMTMIAALQIEMRKFMREKQLEEQDAALKVGADAVKKLREQATTKMIGAIVAGVAQMVGGMAQVAGGTQQSRWVSAGHGDAKSSAAGTTGSAVNTALTGIGTIVNAAQEKKAANEGADQEALQLQVKAHDTKAQQALSLAQEMLDALRDLLQRLTSINQAKADTDRNIVHI